MAYRPLHSLHSRQTDDASATIAKICSAGTDPVISVAPTRCNLSNARSIRFEQRFAARSVRLRVIENAEKARRAPAASSGVRLIKSATGRSSPWITTGGKCVWNVANSRLPRILPHDNVGQPDHVLRVAA